MKDLRYPDPDPAEEPKPVADDVVAEAAPQETDAPISEAGVETPHVEEVAVPVETPAPPQDAVLVEPVEDNAAAANEIAEQPSESLPPPAIEPVPTPATVRPVRNEALFEARELRVARRGAARPEIDNLSLVIQRGETVVLFGEQGCGKETLLRAAAGALSRHQVASGALLLSGEPVTDSAVRVAYLPGPFMKPLSPHVGVVSQLSRVIAKRLGMPQTAAQEELRSALSRLDGAPSLEALSQLPSALPPETLAFALLAAAITQTPDLLLAEHFVADIPLMPARRLIAALLAEQKRLGFAILYSARGAHVVNWLGGRIVVMRQGRVVEEGSAERLASGAAHAYTRTLFQALPRISAESRTIPRGEAMLQVRGLELSATDKDPRALSREGLTFELRRGSALALVGEEGSGRRKLSRTLIGLERPGAGRIVLDSVDIGILSESMLQRMRRRVAFIVGTDDVLDDRMTVWDTVAEPLRAHLNPTRDVLAAQTEGALKRVGLSNLARSVMVANLSAFDRRRLQIARAIVTQPHIAIIEEPLRGLDAFAQGIIRDLLREFRRQEGPAFLVITADFSIADAFAEEVFVFKDGRVIERGSLAKIISNPKELATKALIDAVTAAALPREAARV